MNAFQVTSEPSSVRSARSLLAPYSTPCSRVRAILACTGATGGCTQCPADTYRSADDPPAACLACPVTSKTFALGAKSAAECLCDENTFNAGGSGNSSFSCAAVPEGGWAPRADSRLFALKDFWRPSPNYTDFYMCSASMCLREELPANGSVQLGQSCRVGHTGHLCAVCLDVRPACCGLVRLAFKRLPPALTPLPCFPRTQNWAYQGTVCSECEPGSRYSEWGAARQGGIWFVSFFLLSAAVAVLFFLPLCPRVEAWLQSLIAPAMHKVDFMLSTMAQAARPMSAALRPQSAAKRAQAAPFRPSQPGTDAEPGGASSLLASKTRAIRRSSHTIRIPPGDAPAPPMAAPLHRIRVQRPGRLRVALDLVAEPLRIVVTFWQIVTSFSSSLYVPWPSIYHSLSNSLNVVSLQFLKLPAFSCVQPEVSFYTVRARARTAACAHIC